MLKVIDEFIANQLLLKGVFNQQQSKAILTREYVLLPISLNYLKGAGIKAKEIFSSCLYTDNEYCFKYKEYFLVNSELMQINISQTIKDNYSISLFDKVDFHKIKTVEVNKYLLKAYANLYGYGVQNSLYLAGYRFMYGLSRVPSDVFSTMTIYDKNTHLLYEPHTKIIYKDGSVEQYVGRTVKCNKSIAPIGRDIKGNIEYDMFTKETFPAR